MFLVFMSPGTSIGLIFFNLEITSNQSETRRQALNFLTIMVCYTLEYFKLSAMIYDCRTVLIMKV